MIIVAASIIAILTVPLTGRSLAPLGKLSLRRVWLVWLSIGLQLVITLIPGFPNWLGQPVHLFTFVLSGAFLWSNRRIPGALLVGLGAAMNLAAIAANNGTMPASPWAWRVAGLPAMSHDFENSNITSHAKLWWLGDVFAIPKNWPLNNVFSAGDVIIVVGITYFAHTWCGRNAPVGDDAPTVAPILATAD